MAGFKIKSGADLDTVLEGRVPADNQAPNVGLTAATKNLSILYLPRDPADPKAQLTYFRDKNRDLNEIYFPKGVVLILATWANWGLVSQTIAEAAEIVNAPPVANFTASASGIFGTVFNHSTDPNNNIDYWKVINWGDGSSSGNLTSASSTHQYSSAYYSTTVTISCRVYDTYGLYSDKSVNLLLGKASPPGGSGGCVVLTAYLYEGYCAEFVQDLRSMAVADPLTGEISQAMVSYAQPKRLPCVRFITDGGVELDCSETAPIADAEGNQILAPLLLNCKIPVMVNGVYAIHTVVEVFSIGLQWVMHITVEDNWFLAGNKLGYYVFHHNKINDGQDDTEIQ